MALQKRSIVVENGGAAQSVFEHQIFKMLLPALAFILVGIVTWLFNTVLDLDEKVQQHTIHLEHLHMAEEQPADRQRLSQFSCSKSPEAKLQPSQLRLNYPRNLGPYSLLLQLL